jgi:uncharacterized protein YwqG
MRSFGDRMNRDEAIAVIRGSALSHRLERILPHLAPSMRIRATRGLTADTALVSRFAGRGVLPRGAAWPTWDSSAFHQRWIEHSRALMERNRRGGKQLWEQIERYEALVRDNPKPLDFLAMVRLADVASHAAQLDLPDRGVLLFFYDVERCQGSFWPEARGGWQVIYVPDEADLVVIADRPEPSHGFVPATLVFQEQYSLPADIRAETHDEDLCVYGNAEYERVHGALLGGSTTDQVIHQLRGVPQEVQHGLFHQCRLASNGVDCGHPDDAKDPRVTALAPGAKDWRLLLQLDTDEKGPGWIWGDIGRLYYCLHQDDLASRRFDRGWCVEQCY